jgi:hypothetical protein
MISGERTRLLQLDFAFCHISFPPFGAKCLGQKKLPSGCKSGPQGRKIRLFSMSARNYYFGAEKRVCEKQTIDKLRSERQAFNN